MKDDPKMIHISEVGTWPPEGLTALEPVVPAEGVETWSVIFAQDSPKGDWLRKALYLPEKEEPK